MTLKTATAHELDDFMRALLEMIAEVRAAAGRDAFALCSGSRAPRRALPE